MNLYKKIDNYLLLNYPNIWITRAHVFLPLALVIFMVLFLFNAFVIGYNPANELPEHSSSILLMIIPVLIYLVYWFVMQSRYNVEKSGGKLNLAQDYLNFFIYYLVFTMAIFMVLAIPLSNNYKVANSATLKQINAEKNAINLGYAIVEKSGTVSQHNTSYGFQPVNNPNNFYYSYMFYPEENYDNLNIPYKTVSKKEILKIIDDYVSVYNKYNPTTSFKSAETILQNNILNIDDYNLDDYDYYSYGTNPYQKINYIKQLKERGWYDTFFNDEMLNILSIVIAFFALLTWIFKQIYWKNYMFGIIAVALTPLLTALIGVIIYEVLGFRNDDAIPYLFILAYIIVGVIIFVGIAQPTKRKISIVASMYLQIFLPFLILIIWVIFDTHLSSDNWNYFLISAWIVGILSVGVFKYIYKNLEIKPNQK